MNELDVKVKGWLAKQGFPLEFRTAQIFAAHGLTASQGTYVPDPVSGQLREVDVIASSHLGGDDVVCRTSVVVECKWSRDKPWIVFTTPHGRPSREEAVVQALASSFGEGVMWHLSTDKTLQGYYQQRQPVRVGFGGRQAFTDKGEKDQFYTAIQGVVAAAISVATREDPRPGYIVTGGPMIAHLVYPLIVVDGSLFEAYFDGAEMQTHQITHANVAWQGHEGRDRPVMVEIVSLQALTNYVEEISVHCREVAAYIRNPARTVRDALLSKDGAELKKSMPILPPPMILRGLL